ncbi:MAG: tetratricopeptide repeat protein [Chthonomonadaceae bacterium]|nr:tetratricopeptide repeat protein [Chthonomonadaceae bacterium]
MENEETPRTICERWWDSHSSKGDPGTQEKRDPLDKPTQEEIEKRFVRHYCTLMEQHLPGIDNCYPPAMAFMDTLHNDVVAAFLLAAEHNEKEQTTTLYTALDRYQKYRALWPENLALEETMLAFRRRILPPGHTDIAISLNNLAEWYREQERYAEAEALFQESLLIDRAAIPERRDGIASALNNLALVYDSQGRYAEAEAHNKEALTIWRAMMPPEPVKLAYTLNNLGEVYRVQGLYAQALPLHQEALALRRKSLHGRHPDIAQSLNNLSALYFDQGQYSASEPLLREALSILRAAMGDEHPVTQSIMANYANLQYCKQRSYGTGLRGWWKRILGR